MSKKPAFRAGRDSAALTENMELLTGQRGDGLDKALTLRELDRLGLATFKRVGSAGRVVAQPRPELVGGSAGNSAAQIPNQPLNLAASGAFHNILLSWDAPNYRGHAHTEIWRATDDNLSNASLVGTTNANIYADAVGTALIAWYWVRFVNTGSLPGPYTGPGGVYAETSSAIDDILEEMAGQIDESELTQALTGRLEAHDDTTELWSLKNDAGEITVGIGLLDDGQGGSEIALAAGKVSIFDPANPVTKDNLFVVEGGSVYMNTAYIKDAYIQTLAAGEISADKINALELNAVNITGGTLNIGNNFSVDAAGNLIANNASMSGAITGGTIDIGSNFSVDNTGNMSAKDAVLTGNLTVPNASIDTLQLAGQAVTIPVSTYTASPVTKVTNGGWQTVQSLTVNHTGSAAYAHFCFSAYYSAGSTAVPAVLTGKFRLLRGSTVLGEGSIGTSNQSTRDDPLTFNSSASFGVTSTPSAGNHTYHVQFDAAYNWGGRSVTITNRSLFVLETKR